MTIHPLDPCERGYFQWVKVQDGGATEHDIWTTAFAAGQREGIRQSAQLGISVLVQQLATVSERMEQLARQFGEDDS